MGGRSDSDGESPLPLNSPPSLGVRDSPPGEAPVAEFAGKTIAFESAGGSGTAALSTSLKDADPDCDDDD